MIDYTIGISGLGFVGTAMKDSFTNKSLSIIVYDKFKNNGKELGVFDELLGTEILFLCLPTQFNNKMGTYDISALEETLEKLNNYKGIVVIKSTITPTTLDSLANKYNIDLIHNPEFLTARTAFEDFDNQKHIVLGQSYNCKPEKLNKLVEFYSKYYPSAKISVCNSTESEMMKLFSNSFYAMKVQFFNEIYFACIKTGANFDKVRDMMINNGWINPMHTQVPGPDGKLSYGGLCFPKDTNALLHFLNTNNLPHELIEATIKERNIIREDNDNVIL